MFISTTLTPLLHFKQDKKRLQEITLYWLSVREIKKRDQIVSQTLQEHTMLEHLLLVFFLVI